MKILILGGTGFIGKSISPSLKDHAVTSIGSKFHDFRKEPDYGVFDKDLDVIINWCGWFGGIPCNRKHGKEIYNTNSLINSNIGKLVQTLNPKRYIKIVSGCV